MHTHSTAWLIQPHVVRRQCTLMCAEVFIKAAVPNRQQQGARSTKCSIPEHLRSSPAPVPAVAENPRDLLCYTGFLRYIEHPNGHGAGFLGRHGPCLDQNVSPARLRDSL
eukprot:scaffold310095_cov17-Tisochrysis_lutea.AAC.1